MSDDELEAIIGRYDGAYRSEPGRGPQYDSWRDVPALVAEIRAERAKRQTVQAALRECAAARAELVALIQAIEALCGEADGPSPYVPSMNMPPHGRQRLRAALAGAAPTEEK